VTRDGFFSMRLSHERAAVSASPPIVWLFEGLKVRKRSAAVPASIPTSASISSSEAPKPARR